MVTLNKRITLNNNTNVIIYFSEFINWFLKNVWLKMFLPCLKFILMSPQVWTFLLLFLTEIQYN